MPAPGAADDTAVDAAVIVRELQRRCRRWLVMWSPWRRTYTGFACFTRERMIVDETEFDRFLDSVERIERAHDG